MINSQNDLYIMSGIHEEKNEQLSSESQNVSLHKEEDIRGYTSTRGFASMNQEKQREIARKGGKAAHLKGTAHKFTSEEAREAGRKGGRVVSENREHMATIGRKGGEHRQNH